MAGQEHPIFEILRQRNITMAEFARQIGYSEQHVYNVKGGWQPLKPRFRRACALALRLPESALFSDVPTVREETASV